MARTAIFAVIGRIAVRETICSTKASVVPVMLSRSRVASQANSHNVIATTNLGQKHFQISLFVAGEFGGARIDDDLEVDLD